MRKLFATLLLGSVLSAAALAVPAQQSGTVTITPGTGSAQVRLDLPDSTVQDVTTMRLSVTVSSTDSLQASFVFDDGVQSSVREYRYDAESGQLNIYLSGRTELFADGSLDLGEVRLTTADGNAARAVVSVATDCLEFRNAALGKPDQPDIAPASAEVTLEGKTEQPPADLPDSQPDDNGPAGSDESTGNTGNSSTDTSTGGNQSAGNNNGSSTAHGGAAGTTVQNSVVEQTTLVTTTPAPGISAAGQGSTSSQNTNSGKGTAAPSATPAPEAEDPSTRPADEENLSSVQDNAGNAQTRPDTGSTPETADDGETQTSPFGLVLGILALAVVATGAGIVVFLRRRS